MNKENILKILEGAKDKNGDVPMRLVRLAFKKLPEPCTDIISRRAAIDALDVLCQEHRYKIPGKRETYSQYNEAWQDALDRAEGAIFNLSSAQPEQQWIPCSERLPEKNRKPNTFLVADSDGKLSISKFYFPLSNSDIEKPYWSGMIDVVAWMPLPEPYRGEKND